MKQFIIDTALIIILWITSLITLWKILGYGERLLVRMSRSKDECSFVIRPLNKSKLKIVEEYSRRGLVICLFLISALFIQATFNYQKGYFINLWTLIGAHKIIAITIAFAIYSLMGRINKTRNKNKHSLYCDGKAYQLVDGRIKGVK